MPARSDGASSASSEAQGPTAAAVGTRRREHISVFSCAGSEAEGPTPAAAGTLNCGGKRAGQERKRTCDAPTVATADRQVHGDAGGIGYSGGKSTHGDEDQWHDAPVRASCVSVTEVGAVSATTTVAGADICQPTLRRWGGAVGGSRWAAARARREAEHASGSGAPSCQTFDVQARPSRTVFSGRGASAGHEGSQQAAGATEI